MDGSSKSSETKIVKSKISKILKNQEPGIESFIPITIDEAQALAGVLNNQYLGYDERGLIVSKLLKRVNEVLEGRERDAKEL